MATSDILWIPGILFFSLIVLMVLDPYIKKAKGSDGVFSIVLMALLGVVTAMLIVIFIPKGCGTCRQEVEGFGSHAQGCSATEGFGSCGSHAHSVAEGFAVPTEPTLDSTAFTCPNGAKLYTDMQGNSNCCKGEVDGKTCNGKTICTFSGNALGKYPSCIRPPRVKRWLGSIDLWVQQWLAQNTNYFQNFASIFGPLIYNSDQLIAAYLPAQIKAKIPKEIFTEWNSFVVEEKEWINKLTKNGTDHQILYDQPAIVYQEETMRTLNIIMTLFIKSKIESQLDLKSTIQTVCTGQSS